MILAQIIGALTPLTCSGCGIEGAALCSSCCHEVVHGEQLCFGCGVASMDGAACEACASGKSLLGVAVASQYRAGMQKLVLDMKFHRLRGAVEVATQLMEPVVPSRSFDVITSVPISAARYRERGYNQSELLARGLAREIRLPYRGILGRTSARHQLGMSRAERLEHIRGAFYVSRHRGLHGSRVLIVDDVVTTGATLDECARAMLEAGAASVWGVALARH